jgi:hypothetical protein
MTVDIQPTVSAYQRIAPVEARLAPLFCLGLLVGGCGLASLVLACATPFAAFAVIAGAMLSPPRALLVVVVAWLVNQAISFGLLHYPIEASTILWGFVIGLAALAATAISSVVVHTLRRSGTPVVLALALLAAYCVYEIVLFAATPFLGGAGSFTAAIIVRLGLLNILWLIGLVAVCQVFRQIGGVWRRHAALQQ